MNFMSYHELQQTGEFQYHTAKTLLLSGITRVQDNPVLSQESNGIVELDALHDMLRPFEHVRNASELLASQQDTTPMELADETLQSILLSRTASPAQCYDLAHAWVTATTTGNKRSCPNRVMAWSIVSDSIRPLREDTLTGIAAPQLGFIYERMRAEGHLHGVCRRVGATVTGLATTAYLHAKNR